MNNDNGKPKKNPPRQPGGQPISPRGLPGATPHRSAAGRPAPGSPTEGHIPSGAAPQGRRPSPDAKNVRRRRRVPRLRAAESGRRRALRITLIAVCCLILAIAAAVGIFLIALQNHKPTGNAGTPPPEEETSAVTTDEQYSAPVINSGTTKTRRDDFYTFLVIGEDKISGNTDVMMLASFDVGTHEMTVLQLPRDTYIYKWNKPHKLNSIYGIYYRDAKRSGEYADPVAEGMRSFADTLGQNLGIPVDFYVYVDLEGFRGVIDVLGGVDLYVPFHMIYDDPDQNLYIDLPEGQTHLDGAKAEQFVRYRDGYVTADLGRLDAQRTFLSALAIQLKSRLSGTSAIPTITGMASEAFKHVKTDLSVMDCAYFAREFLSVDSHSIRLIRLPGEAVRWDGNRFGESFFVSNRADCVSLLGSYFNPYTEPLTDADFDPSLVLTVSTKQWFEDVYRAEPTGVLPQDAQTISDGGVNVPHY